jgi:hypothetical protein
MPKRGQNRREKNPLSPRMRRHLGRLGLRSLADYGPWCAARGFLASTEKSVYDLEEELQAHEDDKKRAAQQSRLHANSRKLIEAACSGELDPDTITRPQLRSFCLSVQKSARDSKTRASLCNLLLTVNEEADFLLQGVAFNGVSYNYADALIRIHERRHQWIAPLQAWRRQSHNARRQFSSLVRHLLARYPVPAFMDQAWFRVDPGSERFRDWFIHIGAGKNVRTLDTPIPLSKQMAHHFLEAPADYIIEAAIRWGQVHALGGDRALTEALLGTRLRATFADDTFWTSVIRFFVANPLLDRRHVGPIVDYLYAQRFATREVIVGPGRVEREPPPQPNLTMRGRTAASLLAQVERWHRELGRDSTAENVYFRRSGVKELELKTGKNGADVWRIRELLSGAELAAEGRAMKHCVASYARSCAMGYSSIWAMELQIGGGTRLKRQTIELSRDRVIVQCRGKNNCLPTQAEFSIVKEWARLAGLGISPYVRAAE